MAKQSQAPSQVVQQYLAAQAASEPAVPASPKGKQKNKGVAAPHFSPLSEEAPANSGTAANDIDGLLREAEQALASVNPPNAEVHPPVSMFQYRDLASVPESTESAGLELIREVELDLKIELGRTQMVLEDVLKLRKGSVVSLDRLAGDPVDVFANGRLIARGEVLVLNDNFCVRVTELIS